MSLALHRSRDLHARSGLLRGRAFRFPLALFLILEGVECLADLGRARERHALRLCDGAGVDLGEQAVPRLPAHRLALPRLLPEAEALEGDGPRLWIARLRHAIGLR